MCPLGWVETDGVCFQFVLDQMTFFDAEVNCHQNGAYLATVNSSIRQKTIGEFIHVFMGMNETKNKGIAPWIGATDYVVPGEWRWIGNGQLLNASYTNWDTMDPVNNTSINCALVNAIDQSWSSFNCNNMQGSICEMKPPFLKINQSKVKRR